MHAFQTHTIVTQHRTQLESAARRHRLVRSARSTEVPTRRQAQPRRTWRRVAMSLRLAS